MRLLDRDADSTTRVRVELAKSAFHMKGIEEVEDMEKT
jgi:hypothetical protein